MKITHIYHSGFCIEMDQSVCIFDWYTGELPDFAADKQIYVFVSHSHPDHYGKCIWKLQEHYKKVQYILDKNIPAAEKMQISKIRGGETLQTGLLKVTAFHSTDTGVAFLAEVEGKRFFHAGDLNAWCWEGGPEKDNKWQLGTYKAEVNKLSGILSGEKIHAAFLPLDPRLEKCADMGMLYFLEHIQADMVFPMHYWDHKAEAEKYLEGKLKKYESRMFFQDVKECCM